MAGEIVTGAVLESTRPARIPRMPQLDGWRALSILAVLCAHMLPLGPARWGLNTAAGLLGMSLFFTLSGFLITTTLYFDLSVKNFIIRRLFRILPLAFLFIAVALGFQHAPASYWRAHLLFYVNLPPFWITPYTGHLWSLCVEMHFYALTAAAFLLLRKRAFVVYPILTLLVTLLRMYTHSRYSIVTLYRIDEILAGATLAWLIHGGNAERVRGWMRRLHPGAVLVLLLLSTHARFPTLNYFRPYFAALLVGSTLVGSQESWTNVLSAKPLRFFAGISYALYIFQEPMHEGWFQAGSELVKYAKRPIGFGLAFGLAYLSTRYFESHFIAWGKRLTSSPHRHHDNVPAVTDSPETLFANH